jgi:hypothetical protein
MRKFHFSPEQIELAKEFIRFRDRPDSEEYQEFVARMKQIPVNPKPKPKEIKHTRPGFETTKVKLEDEFDAIVDLPCGWAVVSCYDSGGNHAIENAGLAILRSLWNSWAGTSRPAEKLVALIQG